MSTASMVGLLAALIPFVFLVTASGAEGALNRHAENPDGSKTTRLLVADPGVNSAMAEVSPAKSSMIPPSSLLPIQGEQDKNHVTIAAALPSPVTDPRANITAPNSTNSTFGTQAPSVSFPVGCVNVSGLWRRVNAIASTIQVLQIHCDVAAVGDWPRGLTRGIVKGNTISMFGITATVSGDQIRWTSGDVWARATDVDLTGIWLPTNSSGHSGGIVTIAQTGSAVIAKGGPFAEAAAGYVQGSKIRLAGGNGTVRNLKTNASIKWTSGALWSKLECVDLRGAWRSQNRSGNLTKISQRRCKIVANASWLPKQLEGQVQGTVVMIGSKVGKVIRDTVSWIDGTFWTKVPTKNSIGGNMNITTSLPTPLAAAPVHVVAGSLPPSPQAATPGMANTSTPVASGMLFGLKAVVSVNSSFPSSQFGCGNVTGSWHQVGTVSSRIAIFQTQCELVAIGGWPQGPAKGSIDGNKLSMFGIIATVSEDRIQWASGDVWDRITYTDLTGLWRPTTAFGQNHELVKIMQAGTAVIATGASFAEPLEGYVHGADIKFQDGTSGTSSTVNRQASITWESGAAWLQLQCVDLSGDWYSQSKAGYQATIRQTDCSVVANASWLAKQIEGQVEGDVVLMGSWVGHIIGQQTSTIVGNTISWNDGSLWSKVPCISFAGEWRPVHSLGLSDDRVNITQTGCNFTAAVGSGSYSLVHGVVEGTTVSMLGLVGTLGDKVISWANGAKWAKVACEDLTGKWCTAVLLGEAAFDIDQKDCGVVATGSLSWSPALGFVSDRTIFMFGITGTLVGSATDSARKITWKNGVEWASCATQPGIASNSSRTVGSVAGGDGVPTQGPPNAMMPAPAPAAIGTRRRT